MNLSDKILIIAQWLESAENELLAEASEENLDKVALAFVGAADALKDIADEIQETQPIVADVAPTLTPEKLEEMAAVALAFDESGDELLQKQASVLDEILLTLSAPKDYTFNFKKAEENQLEELKKKYYKDPKIEQDKANKVSEALDAIKKSPVYKAYRPLEAPLSTRSCPDHAGAQMAHVGDGSWQCSLDHKIYNYDTGYTTLKGDKIPGGSVSEQTPSYHDPGNQMFDTRSQRLGTDYQ